MKGQNVRDKLSQWDSRFAPLSEQQKESYMELSTTTSARPLPNLVSGSATASPPIEVAKEKEQELDSVFENSQQVDSHEYYYKMLQWKMYN